MRRYDFLGFQAREWGKGVLDSYFLLTSITILNMGTSVPKLSIGYNGTDLELQWMLEEANFPKV